MKKMFKIQILSEILRNIFVLIEKPSRRITSIIGNFIPTVVPVGRGYDAYILIPKKITEFQFILVYRRKNNSPYSKDDNAKLQ